MGEPISVLILNYNSSLEELKTCVASVDASDSPDLAEIVIADNGSTEHPGACDEVATAFPRARVVELGHNWGFSGGINRGLAACASPRVFILNNDTEMDPHCLSACADALDAQPPECIGTVPKLLFFDNHTLIDAVGNGIDAVGSAFNIGIGQLDIGQYDRVERCFGPCFAAGLFRREAFDDDHVGPLDESYFMYYEDVDWNWRANLFGYKFVTAPEGRVYHVHSGATRRLEYPFKYRLIERNLLTTVLKDAEGGRAVRIWARRMISHALNLLKGRFPVATLRAVGEAFLRLPDTLEKRRQVAARRVLSDAEIFRLAHGERPFFNPTAYEPQYSFANLAFMYQRKAVATGEERWLKVADVARALDGSRLRFEPGIVESRLLPLLADEPPYIHEFVRRIAAER